MTFDYEEGIKTLTETERDAIEDSIGTIASTPYGTAPYIRDMGIRGYPPENASQISRNEYATEVITQCEKWEDRAEVSEVQWNDENEVRMVIAYG
jgi:phage baseplate assembly protein W